MDDPIIAAIGSEKAPILVKLNVFNGRHSLDIRRYFYERGARELKPTQKGIGLNREAFTILKNALDQHGELIEKWLDKEDEHPEHGVRRDHEEQVAVLSELRTQPRPHVADQDKWKSSSFFDVRAEGGTDHITYNQSHKFKRYLDQVFETLTSPLSDEDRQLTVQRLENLFQFILIAYYRSKMLFDDTQQMSAGDIFETLELNWGAILGSYIEADFSS